jgi:hypothetical protein
MLGDARLSIRSVPTTVTGVGLCMPSRTMREPVTVTSSSVATSVVAAGAADWVCAYVSGPPRVKLVATKRHNSRPFERRPCAAQATGRRRMPSIDEVKMSPLG